MNTSSYWERSNKTYDVVIIGAGFLGSWTAYELSKNSDLSIAVIEASTLSQGASTKNAGFACFGSATELLGDLKLLGTNTSIEVTKKRLDGIKKIRSILGDSTISFDHCGGYEIFLHNTSVPSQNEIEELNRILLSQLSIEPFRFLSLKERSFHGFSENVTEIIANPLEGSLHPVKALNALHSLSQSQGVHFLYNRFFQHFDRENQTITIRSNSKEETIFAKKVVYCTNAFSHIGEISPGRGQVFITSVINSLPLRGTYHYDEGYVYFRNVDSKEGKRILIGGGRNIDFTTEKSLEFESNPKIINYLQQFLTKILPTNVSYEIEQSWTGIMGFSQNKLPIIEQINENEFFGFSCNGMGVALTPIISEELASLVTSVN